MPVFALFNSWSTSRRRVYVASLARRSKRTDASCVTQAQAHPRTHTHTHTHMEPTVNSLPHVPTPLPMRVPTASTSESSHCSSSTTDMRVSLTRDTMPVATCRLERALAPAPAPAPAPSPAPDPEPCLWPPLPFDLPLRAARKPTMSPVVILCAGMGAPERGPSFTSVRPNSAEFIVSTTKPTTDTP